MNHSYFLTWLYCNVILILPVALSSAAAAACPLLLMAFNGLSMSSISARPLTSIAAATGARVPSTISSAETGAGDPALLLGGLAAEGSLAAVGVIEGS